MAKWKGKLISLFHDKKKQPHGNLKKDKTINKNKPNLAQDFWSSSTYEMDNNDKKTSFGVGLKKYEVLLDDKPKEFTK